VTKQLDTIGWYIATMHQMLGHHKAAAALGQPPYNPESCILCLYERGKASREDVIEQLGVQR
jgi:hypothetical protein